MKILGIIFRVVIVFVIIFIAGMVGLTANSSDFGEEGPPFDTFEFILLFYMIVSLIIGIVAFKYWKISILSSWGFVITSPFMFFAAIDKKEDVRYVAFYFTGFVIVPLICLLFGYLGSILGSKLVSFFRGR